MIESLHVSNEVFELPQVTASARPRTTCWLIAACLPAFAAVIAWGLRSRLAIDVGTVTAYVALIHLLCTCAVTDSCWLTIPNWATYPALVWAIVISVLAPNSADSAMANSGPRILSRAVELPVGPLDSLLGAIACFLIMVVVYSISKGGAGDVKLATAIGAIIGAKAGILVICYTIILAGVVSLSIAIWSLGPWCIVKSGWQWVGSWLLPQYVLAPTFEQTEVLNRPLPLGIFFGLSTLIAVADFSWSLQ